MVATWSQLRYAVVWRFGSKVVQELKVVLDGEEEGWQSDQEVNCCGK